MPAAITELASILVAIGFDEMSCAMVFGVLPLSFIEGTAQPISNTIAINPRVVGHFIVRSSVNILHNNVPISIDNFRWFRGSGFCSCIDTSTQFGQACCLQVIKVSKYLSMGSCSC